MITTDSVLTKNDRLPGWSEVLSGLSSHGSLVRAPMGWMWELTPSCEILLSRFANALERDADVPEAIDLLVFSSL